MDIYAYAMQMEKDGELYYRQIAAQTTNAGIQNIMNMLASAEVRHYKIFEQLKKHESTAAADLAYLNGIKTIFTEMSEKREPLPGNGSQIEVYKKAQELEKKTRDFYQEQAQAVDSSQRDIFLKIAREEQKHYNILENLIVMLQRPDTWLENAEWYRLEEY